MILNTRVLSECWKGLFRKAVVLFFSHWKAREARKSQQPRDKIVKATCFQNAANSSIVRKILVSVKCSARMRLEMAVPMHGRLEKSAGKNHVHKIPRFLGGGVPA